MKHIWAKYDNKLNTKTVFEYIKKSDENRLLISIAPQYQLFFDDNFVCYGPERTAAGFSRIREVKIPNNIKNIKFIVYDYNFDSYDVDRQDPFFGVEVYEDSKLVAESDSFVSYKMPTHIQETTKYDFQRGFVERFDLRNTNKEFLEVFEVKSPTILEGNKDVSKYTRSDFEFIKESEYQGFDICRDKFPLLERPYIKEVCAYDLIEDFIEGTKTGYSFKEYKLAHEMTGFIEIEITAKEDNTKVFLTWDEYLVDGSKWHFGRSSAFEVIPVTLNKGTYKVLSTVPYALMFLRIIYNKDIEVTPKLIQLQNDSYEFDPVVKDNDAKQILLAASNSFRQNATDIFMDCPGRERAGWLCDSFFTSEAEKFFTNERKIEKHFLENFAVTTCEELEKGMVPMCFPSQHSDGTYIPNWAMWWVLELKKYYLDTHDNDLLETSKAKVFGLVEFFKQFLNEFGLLENLRSWVFIEWSKANSPEYIKGVNFPSNMIYAEMLEAVGELYKDESLAKQSKNIKEQIYKLSFNGEYFIDNAIRNENNELIPCKDHISETCQYYALFANLKHDTEYENRVLNELGPLATDKKLQPSNMFIGHVLRLRWLDSLGKSKQIVEEAKKQFVNMAYRTGTLWENDTPNASCNHGFTSYIAVALYKHYNLLNK